MKDALNKLNISGAQLNEFFASYEARVPVERTAELNGYCNNLLIKGQYTCCTHELAKDDNAGFFKTFAKVVAIMN